MKPAVIKGVRNGYLGIKNCEGAFEGFIKLKHALPYFKANPSHSCFKLSEEKAKNNKKHRKSHKNNS